MTTFKINNNGRVAIRRWLRSVNGHARYAKLWYAKAEQMISVACESAAALFIVNIVGETSFFHGLSLRYAMFDGLCSSSSLPRSAC